MKLKRVIKSTAAIIDVTDPSNIGLTFEHQYEDIIEEPFYKTAFEEYIRWIDFLASFILSTIALILSETKLLIHISTLASAISLAYLYYEIQTLHKEFNDPFKLIKTN